MTEQKNPGVAEIVRMRVVFTVPGMDAVSVSRGLVYKTAGDQPLHMDVYSPSGRPQRRPAVILIHGGPIPRIGARQMGVFVSYGELLAASGFVGVTFDHRFLAPGRLPDAGEDVADAVAHVLTNADSFGVDAGRLALWAFSGGGPLLAAPLRERPSWLRAVVTYYALLDLQQVPPGDDGGISVETREAFSPIRSLGEGGSAPPILVARAGRDNAWLNESIDRFVRTALEAGATLDLLNHPEGRHGFDLLDDVGRSRAIIRHTLAFLTEHLAP